MDLLADLMIVDYAYTDFSSDSVDLMDEDAVVFSVSASF